MLHGQEQLNKIKRAGAPLSYQIVAAARTGLWAGRRTAGRGIEAQQFGWPAKQLEVNESDPYIVTEPGAVHDSGSLKLQ